MRNERLFTRQSNDELELRRQIAQLKKRVEEHGRRGRSWGTYEHQRLAELENLLRELEDGKQNVEGRNSQG